MSAISSGAGGNATPSSIAPRASRKKFCQIHDNVKYKFEDTQLTADMVLFKSSRLLDEK
jgi:hypothetical protein